MFFMNRWEIDERAHQHRNHPVLGPATQYLVAFRDLVDANSDGWAYWAAAPRAAKRLMELCDTPPIGADDVTIEEVRRSLSPIKRLCTKHNLTPPMLKTFQPRLHGMEHLPGTY